MKRDRKASVINNVDRGEALAKRQGRREFLLKTGGILAAGAFGAVPLRGWAADPVNIGALYPTTGSMAQIGVGCVAEGFDWGDRPGVGSSEVMVASPASSTAGHEKGHTWRLGQHRRMAGSCRRSSLATGGFL